MAPGIENHEHTTETGISLPSTDTDTLLHHSLVTSSPDALKFHAAASLQLQFGQKHDSVAKSDSNNNDNKLIVSPYNEPLHLLDLQTLDTPNQVLAKALTVFKPIRDDYATAPYTESFNWSAVFDFLRDLSETKGYIWKKQDFYVVVFRSILRPDADLDRLHELDAHSHQEAIASGGLLKYWFGSRNGEGENLATCIWRSKTDARLGGTGPWHKKARGAAPDMYERIVFKTLKMVVEDGIKAWSIRDWTDDDDE